MKKIILIVVGVILVALLGRLGWAFWQVQKDEAMVDGTSTLVATTTPAPVQVAVTPIIATTTPKPVANQVKSEIDKYGVDLYKLKQGETVIEKTIPEKIKIVYARYENEIDREVTKPAPYGGITGTTDTIDLSAKENLLASIKETGAEIDVDCKNGSEKHCANGKKRLDYLKTKCLTLKENVEIGACMSEGFKDALTRPTEELLQKMMDPRALVVKTLMDVAIVRRLYENSVHVTPSQRDMPKIVGLSITNPTAGGVQPISYIDPSETGNYRWIVKWTPNNADFVRTKAFHITAKLEDGAEVRIETPVEVRRERLVYEVELEDNEKSYSDPEGRYLVSIKRRDAAKPITGTLKITEEFDSSGAFSPIFLVSNTADLRIIEEPISKLFR